MNNTTSTEIKNNQLSYDMYSNLPPPPYTKSSPSSSSSTVNNSAQAAASKNNRDNSNEETFFAENSAHGITSEPLAALQHIKDYFTRLKDQSFTGLITHENSSDNNNLTDTDPADENRSTITINNIIMPSFRSSPEHQPSSTDMLINEGLERIGHSLQQLIYEAQASLTKIPSQQQKRPQPQPLPFATHADMKSQESMSSHHIHRLRYSQSQEKITVAMEQLEQSIRSMSLSDMVTHSDEADVSHISSIVSTVQHHNKRPDTPVSTSTCSPSPKPPANNDDSSKIMRFIKSRLWRLFIAGTAAALFVSVYYFISHQRKKGTLLKYDTVVSLTLFIISFYLKKISRERTLVTPIDKFLIRSMCRRPKTSTGVLKWIHRVNVCINTFTIINGL